MDVMCLSSLIKIPVIFWHVINIVKYEAVPVREVFEGLQKPDVE